MNIKSFFFLLVFLGACSQSDTCPPESRDYREDMRSFVRDLSHYAKTQNPDFIVIPQNGIELITKNGEANGELNYDYLAAIDGHGQEDLFFGYHQDNQRTPENESQYLIDFLSLSQDQNKTILVTDYCQSPDHVTTSKQLNQAQGFISFAAPGRDLSAIPEHPPSQFNEHAIDILTDARNFLYLINPILFSSADAFMAALSSTNYDLLIIDYFMDTHLALTHEQTTRLKQKANGESRLAIAYLSIGEAEDYRYYWDPKWNSEPPDWLEEENPHWEGNYKVRYWDTDWKNIIFGSDSAYLDRIIQAGFDGIYLDIIDAFEYFENKQH